MRRKEMIDAIVYEALSWDGLDTGGVPLEEIANDMLKVVEKHGMLPPISKVGYLQSNQWEPEGPGHFVVSNEEFERILDYLESNGEPSETIKKARERFLELKKGK